MARGGAAAGRGLEKKESSLMFREISPPHKWDQDLHSHYLRLTLPGFVNKDISLHMDKYGHLVVRGSHQMTEHKYVSFNEAFDVPDGSDLEGAEGVFENDQIYCVTIPKTTKLGHIHEDGGSSKSKPKGVKLGVHFQNEDSKGHDSISPNIEPTRRLLPLIISRDKSMKKFLFLLAILIAVYAAWLNRDFNY